MGGKMKVANLLPLKEKTYNKQLASTPHKFPQTRTFVHSNFSEHIHANRKDLISLFECTGWSKTSLFAQAKKPPSRVAINIAPCDQWWIQFLSLTFFDVPRNYTYSLEYWNNKDIVTEKWNYHRHFDGIDTSQTRLAPLSSSRRQDGISTIKFSWWQVS